MTDSKPATDNTVQANALLQQTLAFDDTEDFALAHRGFVAPLPDDGVIRTAEGAVVWNLPDKAQAPEGQDPPDTVNPSLWRMAQLLGVSGLFEVTEGIYQVRGADLSVISFVEAPGGIIVVDPCLSAEPTRGALDLYREHRGDRPVAGVIYTHSLPTTTAVSVASSTRPTSGPERYRSWLRRGLSRRPSTSSSSRATPAAAAPACSTAPWSRADHGAR